MAYNILIVDDSQTMRSIIAKNLEMASLDLGSILFAVNGKDALEKLANNWVDLVITDLNMPEMSGVQLVEAMSKDGLLNATPVIVVSTDGSTERIAALRQMGIREYLRKPFTPESVSEVIIRVLGEQNDRPDSL